MRSRAEDERRFEEEAAARAEECLTLAATAQERRQELETLEKEREAASQRRSDEEQLLEHTKAAQYDLPSEGDTEQVRPRLLGKPELQQGRNALEDGAAVEVEAQAVATKSTPMKIAWNSAQEPEGVIQDLESWRAVWARLLRGYRLATCPSF